MSTWLSSTFGTSNPVIAMLHLAPMPADPHYDSARGVGAVVERARADLAALQGGQVDAVMFSNEFSLPYLTTTEPVTATTMARIVGELKSELSVPHGVNVLWDAKASLDLAAATDAAFIREIFTGVYASDFGLWNTNVGEVVRHRSRIGAGHVKLLYNIVPESAEYLAQRDLASITKTTVFTCQPDALCVSGSTAGLETDAVALQTVKDNAGEVPVFVNTGVTADNVADRLSSVDGAVIGTYFKENGVFENMVDAGRVKDLMSRVHAARS